MLAWFGWDILQVGYVKLRFHVLILAGHRLEISLLNTTVVNNCKLGNTDNAVIYIFLNMLCMSEVAERNIKIPMPAKTNMQYNGFPNS